MRRPESCPVPSPDAGATRRSEPGSKWGEAWLGRPLLTVYRSSISTTVVPRTLSACTARAGSRRPGP
jgi:hypothetical protein